MALYSLDLKKYILPKYEILAGTAVVVKIKILISDVSSSAFIFIDFLSLVN